jgi:hypothetical protein
VLCVVALVWLLAFSGYFFTRTLPNNPDNNRLDLLIETPSQLLDNIVPADVDPFGLRPSGWRYLPQRFDLLGVAVSILGAAWGLGHLVLRLLRVRSREASAARTVFAFGAGLSGWSMVTLLLGLAGFLMRPLFICLMAAGFLGECWCRWRFDRATGDASEDQQAPEWRRWFSRASFVYPLVVVTVSPFLLAMLLGAMLPSVDFDVKEYHLEGPKEYFQAGQITFLPHNVYTSFPFLTEMLSLLAMVLRGDWFRGALAGKAVLMAFAPLTALGVYAAGRLIRPSVGLCGALVYLTTPWVYRISIIAYAEGGLAFYLLATLLAVLSMTPIISRHVGDSRGGYLLIGFLAGSAVACKYPGVLSVALPMGLAVAAAGLFCPAITEPRLSRLPARARAAGWFIAGAVVTFGPWALKNWWQTGNPVYPLLYSRFGGADWNAALNAKFRAGHALPVEMLRTPSAWPGDLWRHLVDVAALSDWQSVLMFAFAPLSLLAIRRPTQETAETETGTNRTLQFLWFYAAWLFLMWWGLTHRIDRFWVPMLPVLALLAGIGVVALWLRTGELSRIDVRAPVVLIGRTVLVVLVAVAVLFNLAFVTTGLGGYNAYLLNLNVARQQAMTPSMRVLNNSLPEESRVLLVGDAAVFDAEFECVYNTVFDQSIFEDWFAASTTPGADGEFQIRPAAEIRKTLRDHGITHVFVNWAEILRYREPGSYGYTDFACPATFRRLVAMELLQPLALPPRESVMDVEALPGGQRQELEQWAPELVRPYYERDVIAAYELFEVRSDE